MRKPPSLSALRVPVLSALWLAAATGALGGCESSLTLAETGHDDCGPGGECAPGYVCQSATNKCVSESTTITSGTGAAAGSGTSSAGGGTGSKGTGAGGTASTGGATSSSSAGGSGGATACPEDTTNCGGSCVDVSSDPTHCGDCQTTCGAPVSGADTGQATCESASCDVSCGGAATECAVEGGEACVDTKTDSRHCGACGVACAPGTKCVNSGCVAACGPGLTSCGGQCVNLQTAHQHCGTCATKCTTALGGLPACSKGSCQSACAAGLTACAAGILGEKSCANLQVDPKNCGACDNECASGQLCVMGQCEGFLYAAACWECGNGNAFPQCCTSGGQTICVTGDCPQ